MPNYHCWRFQRQNQRLTIALLHLDHGMWSRGLRYNQLPQSTGWSPYTYLRSSWRPSTHSWRLSDIHSFIILWYHLPVFFDLIIPLPHLIFLPRPTPFGVITLPAGAVSMTHWFADLGTTVASRLMLIYMLLILLRVPFYILHFSKPGKQQYPEWPYHACNQAVSLKNRVQPVAMLTQPSIP